MIESINTNQLQRNIQSNRYNMQAFRANKDKTNGDKFEKSDPTFGFSKKSIWAGIATAIATGCLMFCSNNKISRTLWHIEENIWNFTFIPLPIIIGGVTGILTELFSKNKNKNQK